VQKFLNGQKTPAKKLDLPDYLDIWADHSLGIQCPGGL
jgi:hypothetical protein